MTRSKGGQRRGRARGKGIVTVELALILPVMLALLLGVIEVGSMVGDAVALNAAARAGARSAAVGADMSSIDARILAVGSGLDSSRLTITLSYRQYGDSGWSDWASLADAADGTATVNSAPAQAEVRVSLAYRHQLLVPGLFGSLGDPGGADYRTLHASASMQRE